MLVPDRWEKSGPERDGFLASHILRPDGRSAQGASDALEPVRIAEFLREENPEPEHILHNVFRLGQKLLLSGPSKSMKSFLLLQLAICVAAGKPWLGIPTKKRRVLLVDLELQACDLDKRVRQMAIRLGVDPEAMDLEVIGLRHRIRGMREFRSWYESRISSGAYDLVVIDPFYKLFDRGMDINQEGDALAILDHLSSLFLHDERSALAIAHHFPKGGGSRADAADRPSGSAALGRDFDVLISVTRDASGRLRQLQFTQRAFPELYIAAEWSDGLFEVNEDATQRGPKSASSGESWKPPVVVGTQDVVAVLKSQGEMISKELESALQERVKGASLKKAKAAMNTAVGAGGVVCRPRGTAKVYSLSEA